MDNFTKFKELVLGTPDIPTWLAGFLFAFIGLVIYYKNVIGKRDKTSMNTPYSFSLKFFIQDNLSDIISNIIYIFLALRFSNEFAGADVTPWYSLGIGLGISKVSEWICKVQEAARK